MQNPQDVQLAAAALKAALPPELTENATEAVGIVLGTGLSGVAECIAGSGAKVPFAHLPNFPASGVQSHAGAFIAGRLGGRPVLAQQGRCHLYEGRTPAQVCMGVRVMRAIGIRTLVITNAAGALNPLFSSGEVMLMSDIINHTGASPLTGDNCDEWGERFPDMSRVFDGGLARCAMRAALANAIRLFEGVYIGVAGPQMETPAETRMYRQWGADAVGMSTVLEVIAARHLGMRIIGLSCLTNKNLPDCMAPAPLEEVIRMAGVAAAKLEVLLPAICAELPD